MKLKLIFPVLLFPFVLFSQWQGIGSGFGSGIDFILDFSIVDSNTIWSLGTSQADFTVNPVQQFSLTTNGGQSFISGEINGDDTSLNIYGIHGFDSTHAWVYGNHIPFVDSGAVYETTDGGNSWLPLNFPFTGETRPAVMHFLNADTVITYGGALTAGLQTNVNIWYSYDAGNTWAQVPDTSLNLLPNEQIITINPSAHSAQVGNTLWFGTSRGRVFKTTDAGQTWNAYNVTLNQAIVTISFYDEMTGIAATGDMTFNASVYTTTDGGVSWSLLNTNSMNVIPLALYYIPETSNLMACGVNGFEVSYNNGTSWSDYGQNFVYTSVFFQDKDHGWAGGPVLSPTSGGIYKWMGDSISLSQKDVFRTTVKNVFYPNPATDKIYVEDCNHIVIYDSFGRKVIEKNSIDMEEINVSFLPSGLYTLKYMLLNGDEGLDTFIISR